MRVSFLNCDEIRIGSPHNICDWDLQGDWVPKLPEEDRQNITASSPEESYAALVDWGIHSDNKPTFKLYKIDTQDQAFKTSKRIEGCCLEVRWEPDFDDFVCERL